MWKPMMKLWRVPVYYRSTAVGEISLRAKRHLACVDDVGLFVDFEGENPPSDEVIRQHICGRSLANLFIAGDNEKEVVANFYQKHEGANVGGNDTFEQRAIWIADEHAIIELPVCALLHQNTQEQWICGPDDGSGEGNGILGGCVLAGYEGPDGLICPFREVFNLAGTGFDAHNLFRKPISKEHSYVADSVWPARQYLVFHPEALLRAKLGAERWDNDAQVRQGMAESDTLTR